MKQNLKIRFDIGGDGVYAMKDKVLVMDNPIRDETYRYPFSMDSVGVIVITGGHLDCRIDMKDFHIDKSGMLVIFPFQTVENLSFGDDFKGKVVVYSKSFFDNLSISDSFQRFMNIKSVPFSLVAGESMKATMTYIEMISSTISQKDHPYREEVVRLLTQAFCLGLGYYIHPDVTKANRNRADAISERFIELVRENCMTSRDLGFYADQLCISIKHLSAMVRKSTGKAPSKWIEDYTILRSKQLLSSTRDSVAEISDRMSFANSSDFGKYFKKMTGMTPLSFRTSQTY